MIKKFNLMLKTANVKLCYDTPESQKYINQAKIMDLNGIFYF